MLIFAHYLKKLHLLSSLDIRLDDWNRTRETRSGTKKLEKESSKESFVARPVKNQDGTPNGFVWNCTIPGIQDTLREGGLYKVS